ncbi:MAG TPA: hypothetical protein VFD92_01945 [Candidatus Binatia bacterium]|nr:hypothetical protein [Candidatus Binatia bacterium]
MLVDRFKVLLCTIACVVASRAIVAEAVTDPFQRYITFKNELPIKIYPVIASNEKDNCGPLSKQRRIIVNKGAKGAGLATGDLVKVTIPKNPPCWYNAVRVYIFPVDLTTYESRANVVQRTVADNMVWNPPLCDNDACWTGNASDQYPLDAPAQLVEYTIDSINPSTGRGFPDRNNPAGIPMVDIDLSYVDEVYLPLAINLEDGGATRFMGTVMPYATFNQRTQSFLDIQDNGNPLWSQFAAYTTLNWPNNIFNDLGASRTNHIEGAFNFVHNVRTVAESALYTPTSNGDPAACSATPACSQLAGDCCPSPGGFLECCNTRPFLIDGTIKMGPGNISNASVNNLAARWKKWIDTDPCTNIGAITDWPSNLPSFNKQQFCNRFRETVRYVWNYFDDFGQCAGLAGNAKDLCVLDLIVGFLPDNSENGRLNQSVQALQRSVPWGNIMGDQLGYQFDKFILFWAPYNSPFNLNPYTRLVHNKDDGLDAPGAYSFSIDDRFGNFQNRGSGFIVDVGGSSVLANKEPFDFYQQYRAVWGPGWHHVKVCGSLVTIPNTTIGGNAPISFWQDGVKKQYCRMSFYKTASNTTDFITLKVEEVPKMVTDTYTGEMHQIKELHIPNPNFCMNQSSPNLKNLCAQTMLAITASGEEAYIAVPDAQKPFVNYQVPPAP